MATKIMIDPGHGGYDNGATYQGCKEKDDALKLALAVGDILKKDGYDVVYTRTDDTYTSPTGKARLGNESGADYFVSIHRNSASSPNLYNGVQTLVYNNSGIKSAMADNVNEELAKVGYNNIGIEERPNLAVLRRTKMPAILVEAGFINSDEDNALFDQKFNETANAIATGIEKTLQPSAATASGEYQLLLGCYRTFESALTALNSLLDYGYDANMYFDDDIYQIRIGNYDTSEDALGTKDDLRENGIEALLVGINPDLSLIDHTSLEN